MQILFIVERFSLNAMQPLAKEKNTQTYKHPRTHARINFRCERYEIRTTRSLSLFLYEKEEKEIKDKNKARKNDVRVSSEEYNQSNTYIHTHARTLAHEDTTGAKFRREY